MQTKYIKFKNSDELELSARLELPVGTKPTAYAIFAHCFTCGKNARAATNISRQLTQSGFGVLRFDFTGLGDSEGDFADTGFTTNISDLVSAAAFLDEFYQSPSLLIGHSLGGTAVIHAAAKIESVKAVCTIAAPAEADHVLRLMKHNRAEIEENGKAEVNIGGRPFMIGNTFITDIEKHSTASVLAKLNKAILIIHSPEDRVVKIANAGELYNAAQYPKSFISLDGADHLVLDSNDSEYVSELIGTWVKRYISEDKSQQLNTENQTAVRLSGDKFTSEIVTGTHRFLADEPKSVGGNDLGPSPYQLLNAALGACTAMTLKMYADRKKWDLSEVTVHLNHKSHYATDMENPESSKSKIDVFERVLEITGDLDDDKRKRLLEIANKCPVHRTLTNTEVKIETPLQDN